MVLLDANNVTFWSHILSVLKQWDTFLFLKINNDWTNPFLDSVYPWWRDSLTWYPLYLFLFVFSLSNFGWRIWPWILFFILTAVLTDQLSSTIIKGWVNRPRPCSDTVLMYQVRLLLGYCPGNGSFTSSHAANHFGAACYIFFSLRAYLKKWGYLFFLWAITICYGQIYVGIHYPLDIIGGAAAGCFIGILTASFFNRRIGMPPLLSEKKNQASH